MTVTSLQLVSGQVVAAVAFGGIALRAAWQATRAVAVFDRALRQGVEGAGLVPIGAPRPGMAGAAGAQASPSHAPRGA